MIDKKGYEYVGREEGKTKKMEYGRAGGKFQQGKDLTGE